jgi:hypothetical protein
MKLADAISPASAGESPKPGHHAGQDRRIGKPPKTHRNRHGNGAGKGGRDKVRVQRGVQSGHALPIAMQHGDDKRQNLMVSFSGVNGTAVSQAG